MLNAVRPFVDFYRLASFGSHEPPRHPSGRAWSDILLGWLAAVRARLERIASAQ